MAGSYGRMTPQQIQAWQARVKADPHAAYQAALAHRSASSTSPTPYRLSPAQAAQLIANQRVVAPGLTAGQLNTDVNAGAAEKYGPAQSQLQRRPGLIGDFFAQYQQLIKQAGADQAAVNSQATQGVKDLQGGLDQASKSQWAGQRAAMAGDAANRGATVDPGLADQAKNASLVRGILTNSYGAMLTSQGANTSAGLVSRGVNAKQAEGEQLTANAQALQDLLKQKGAFKTAERQQVIGDANNNYLKQMLAQGQAAQAGASAGLSNARAQGVRVTTAFVRKYGRLPSTADPNSPSAKLDNARLDYFNKHGYFPPTGPPKPVKPTGKDQFGNTPKDRQRSQNSWDRAKTIGKLIGGKDVQSLASEIVFKDASVPPWMALAAAQQIVNGYVGPHSAQRLGRAGVKGGVSTSKPSTPAGGATALPVAPGGHGKT